MRAFEYASPKTREQAVRLLAAKPGESAVLAGGSDLLALMKDEVETPGRLVDVKGVEGLSGIRRGGDGSLSIGALTTIHDLSLDPQVARELPALARAAGEVAGPQIRHVGTLGGNLCQRPRCWYYRNGFGLLAMKDGRSMVVDGDNRYHAILGNDGPARFVQPSTIAPLLVALGAEVALAGPEGERRLPLADFFRVPQGEGEREHDLRPGEMVTEVRIPAAAGRRLGHAEVRQRETLDWSLATASAALDLAGDGRVREARVVLGQVAPTPWEARAAQDFLRGKVIDDSVARQAGEAAVQGARALSRNRYKIQLARVAVQRALLDAVASER